MAGNCHGLSNARAVWDLITGDAHRFCDRLQLIIDAAEEFAANDIPSDFVILIHGPATQFAARSLVGTKFANSEITSHPTAHGLLQKFVDRGGRVEVCGIAMERCAIAKDNLIACTVVERNVFVSAVALQNRGYAYMLIF